MAKRDTAWIKDRLHYMVGYFNAQAALDNDRELRREASANVAALEALLCDDEMLNDMLGSQELNRG